MNYKTTDANNVQNILVVVENWLNYAKINSVVLPLKSNYQGEIIGDMLV